MPARLWQAAIGYRSFPDRPGQCTSPRRIKLAMTPPFPDQAEFRPAYAALAAAATA
jgi:hypothetical protein